MSCRNITLKPLPLPRLNTPRLLSDLSACLLSLPNPFSLYRSWECHVDSVRLCAVSLRCGKVAWELPGLSGTSEGGPRGQPRRRHCCQEPWRTGSAWAVGPAPYCLRVAIFAFCCSSSMVMAPQLHIVDFTLYRDLSTLSCRGPAEVT